MSASGLAANIDDDFLSAADVQDRYGVDLATAETIRAGLIEVSRHMHETLNRSGFSNVVREQLDAGTAVHLVTPEGTEEVAITEGATHFAFTFQHMTNMVVEEWGIDNLQPGDTLICNDPYRGSIHNPDVNLFRPIFWEGEPVFVLSDAAHILDIGGPVPGGLVNSAQTLFEEGLRIPPMLILSGDVPVRSTINLLLENARMQTFNLGDIRALFGTMKVGEQRLRVMLERYGLDAVRGAANYTLDLAERRMRRAIAAVPDGIYQSDQWLDDDGRGGDPVRLSAAGIVRGRSIEIDYSGSQRQPIGAATTAWQETNRCLIGAKLILDPRHPMNAGAMRPFHVVAPPGSVVMGLPPTSVSGHCEIGAKVSSLMTDIFGQMLPDRAVASESGTTNCHIVTGLDGRAGRNSMPFGVVIAGGSAWGATSTGDGISFNVTPIFNVADNVIELLERDTPVLVRGRNLLIDSAGPGRYRSGYTTTVTIEVVNGDNPAFFSSAFGAGRFPARGMRGGGDGMTSYLFSVDRTKPVFQNGGITALDDLKPLCGLFNADGFPDSANGEWQTSEETQTLMVADWPVPPEGLIYIVCATGGGYGDPLTRDPDLVRIDVWNEKVSPDYAREVYGVVIDPVSLAVDVSATRERREAAKGSGVPHGGPLKWPRSREELASSFTLSTPRRLPEAMGAAS